MNCDSRGGKFAEHDCGVAAQFDWVRQQNHLYLFPLLVQAACRDKSVAPVVTLPTENYHATRFAVMRQNVISNRGARILHERERWHAEALAGGAVNGSHFFCTNDFHKKAVASVQWRVFSI